MRVCVRLSTWPFVSETKEKVHEVTSCQLFDFPSFPGKQFQEQCRRKTTNQWQLKYRKKQRKWLFVGDWIIAVVWDWRHGKYVSDCTIFVPDTYHLPDSSTHLSPRTPHNSRNTLKKSASGGKGTQDKYCVSISPTCPFQLFLALTDEQCNSLNFFFYFCVQNRADKTRLTVAETE